MSLSFPLSLLRERNGNIGNTQGTYILFPIDPNVADVFSLVHLCSQCTPCSLCSQCIFHYSLSIYVSSVFPIVSVCSLCGLHCSQCSLLNPVLLMCLLPCFSYFSPSVSRLSLVFWLCNLWEATLTSPLVGGMWTDTIGNTLGNILRTIGNYGEHTGYTLGTRPTVWIIERAHWEHKKHRGGRVEGLSSCFLRIRSSFNVQCLWVFL